jgi:hypothetical protein
VPSKRKVNTQRKAKNVVCAVGNDICVILLDVKLSKFTSGLIRHPKTRDKIMLKSIEKK